MDVKIHLIPMRENPPTIKAKSVCTGKPVAVTLITEFQEYLTPPFSNWTLSAKETVERLTQQFENPPNGEVLLQGFNKTEETNPFSEESKDLITDIGNTEIFELCETSSKKQCPDCAFFFFGKLASYTAHVANACCPQKRIDR